MECHGRGVGGRGFDGSARGGKLPGGEVGFGGNAELSLVLVVASLGI